MTSDLRTLLRRRAQREARVWLVALAALTVFLVAPSVTILHTAHHETRQ